MAQYKAFEKGIFVNGQTILSFANGMGRYKELGLEILADYGLKDIVENNWYPMQAWLDAFKNIADEIGDATLFDIGVAIPDSADFPPKIAGIEEGLQAIDIAYHLNHSKNGKDPMYNNETGEMQEGIGHYFFEKLSPNSAKIIGDNPYPCEFDKGIITAMAHKFNPAAEVTTDNSVENRKSGGKTSTYIIKW